MAAMMIISKHDTGSAVEDVQQRLCVVGLLPEDEVDGVFGDNTEAALRRFCEQSGLPFAQGVDEKVWATLVDASFCLGDRTLYLRMPYFHGHDVLELQQALGALGFFCGEDDGIFGAFTESALRKFQLNMGLPSDGIAGAFTFAAIRNLHHSWEGKSPVHAAPRTGFARAADVLERHALCLFGTSEFTRSVASRMSNLALATNPASKIMSAESLLVEPDDDMLLVRIVLPEEATEGCPRVLFAPAESLAVRLQAAIDAAGVASPSRIAVELPGTVWCEAGPDRSAQHFAITLLDALCTALP
uniref:Peptidoglycan-binding protein n=1 Tax=Muribaculaceae bacterium Z82 TaxID=2304548 RepID=A0A7C9JMJ6_9BACT